VRREGARGVSSFLKSGVAHLFFAHPTSLLAAAPGHLAWLSEVERQRAERFRQPGDAERYRATRVLVRGVLGSLLGHVPAELAFVEGAHGRPRLAPGTASVDFNASRSRAWVALLVTGGAPCGVDVEDTSRKANVEAIARAFAPEEQAFLLEKSGEERRRRFFALWTLKEAALKGLGRGLTLSLGACAFRLEEGGLPQATFSSAAGDEAAEWCFTQLAPDARHLLAVAVRSRTPSELLLHDDAATCARVAGVAQEGL
jgi:4'-phosphopantetheinyl transferase